MGIEGVERALGQPVEVRPVGVAAGRSALKYCRASVDWPTSSNAERAPALNRGPSWAPGRRPPDCSRGRSRNRRRWWWLPRMAAEVGRRWRWRGADRHACLHRCRPGASGPIKLAPESWRSPAAGRRASRRGLVPMGLPTGPRRACRDSLHLNRAIGLVVSNS